VVLAPQFLGQRVEFLQICVAVALTEISRLQPVIGEFRRVLLLVIPDDLENFPRIIVLNFGTRIENSQVADKKKSKQIYLNALRLHGGIESLPVDDSAR
jgi:hypothetical protein